MSPFILPTKRPWQPLLDVALRRRAKALFDELCAHVRDSSPSSSSLAGSAGHALLWRYADLAWPGFGFAESCEAALDTAGRQLANEIGQPALLAGFVGTAWVVQHLANGVDDPVADIDAALVDYLTESPWSGDFDLCVGLAGIGLYSSFRLKTPNGRICLERVVEHLESLAAPRGSGFAWLSRPAHLPTSTLARWPQGYYSYGVAHGAPAVALVLAAAVAADVGRARARPLVDGALRWIWAGYRGPSAPSAFDLFEQDDTVNVPARLAWCYGDAGIAATLHATARALGDEAGAARALAVARASVGRPLDKTGVVDVGLCHGSAGLALLYARLAHESGDPLLADAARHWYAILIGQYERGVAFDPARVAAGENPAADHSLLTGSTGVALALLAGITAIEPEWDCLLAASLPRL